MSTPPPAGLAVISCDLVLVILGILSVSMRVVAMYLRGRKIKAHDVLVFVGLVISIGAVVNQINGVYNAGIGTHIADIPPQDQSSKMIGTLKAIVIADILWILSTSTIKLSILLMYQEVFDKPLFHLACTSATALVSLTMLAFLLAQFFVCSPFSDNWNLAATECHKKTFNYANATAWVNVFVDAAIAVLPIPVLAGLQVPLAKKLGLAALLSLGLSICATNITRLALFSHLNPSDITHSIAVPSILSTLELYLGILVACAPFIRSLFKPLPPSPARMSASSSTRFTAGSGSGSDASNSTVGKGRGGSGGSVGGNGGWSGKGGALGKGEDVQGVGFDAMVVSGTDTGEIGKAIQMTGSNAV